MPTSNITDQVMQSKYNTCPDILLCQGRYDELISVIASPTFVDEDLLDRFTLKK